MSSNTQPTIRGIIVPMVTPLTGPDKLDDGALEQLVAHLLAGGVHGLFLLGTCGEGPSLSSRLRREVITRVCQQVAGRVPVLVSVTDTAPSEADRIAQSAADAGADAVVIAPPFYLPLGQYELFEYVTNRVRASPLPVMLYDMPALTKLVFEPETVTALSKNHRILGLKDSSGDTNYFDAIQHSTRERPDWTLLVGPEHLLVRSLRQGGDGGVCGGANVFPQLFVSIYEASIANCTESLNSLASKATALGQIYEIGSLSAASVIKALKSALAVIGIGNGLPAQPLQPLTVEENERVRKIIQTLASELLVADSAERRLRL